MAAKPVFDSIVKPRPARLTARVQLDLFTRQLRVRPPDHDWLLIGPRPVRLWLARNGRARRYILRLRPDGSARVTIPRGGSAAEARRFAERHAGWIEKQLQLQAAQPARSRTGGPARKSSSRGERVRLEAGANGEAGLVRFGDQVARVTDPTVICGPRSSASSGGWPRANCRRACSNWPRSTRCRCGA